MKWIIICLVIVAVAIFTGTWIFNGAAWILNACANGFKFLSKIFNLFGWNDGLLAVSPLAIIGV